MTISKKTALLSGAATSLVVLALSASPLLAQKLSQTPNKQVQEQHKEMMSQMKNMEEMMTQCKEMMSSMKQGHTGTNNSPEKPGPEHPQHHPGK